MNSDLCKQHSGFDARIAHIETDNEKQWGKMRKMENDMDESVKAINKKQDAVYSRLNYLIISVALTAVGIAIDAVIRIVTN